MRKDYELLLELHMKYVGYTHQVPYFSTLYHYAFNHVAQQHPVSFQSLLMHLKSSDFYSQPIAPTDCYTLVLFVLALQHGPIDAYTRQISLTICDHLQLVSYSFKHLLLEVIYIHQLSPLFHSPHRHHFPQLRRDHGLFRRALSVGLHHCP